MFSCASPATKKPYAPLQLVFWRPLYTHRERVVHCVAGALPGVAIYSIIGWVAVHPSVRLAPSVVDTSD